jgi:hypothetical protein
VRLVPIAVLVDEETLERLTPIHDEIRDALMMTPMTDGQRIAYRLNGWTHEMLAWGFLLRALNAVELELVVEARDGQ